MRRLHSQGKVYWIVLSALLIGALSVTVVYVRDMRRAYARVDGATKVVASPYGDIQYTEGGSGPPVLVIHGSGGGYDQGELIAHAVLSDRVRWIAPSRFGYLQSTFQPGATFEDQARAYAFLLDRLGIKQVAVVALSHGGPSALLFAARYPERVTSLTLLSCGVASANSADQAQANKKGDRLAGIFKYDFAYWALSKFFRARLIELMGANAQIVAALTVEQQQLIDQVIDFMNPVAPRSAGASFDNQAQMPNERVAAIRAPTLIVHATDDTLQLFRNAEYAAAHIPGAQLLRFDHGGHLLIAVEQPAVKREVQTFIATHPAHGDPQ